MFEDTPPVETSHESEKDMFEDPPPVETSPVKPVSSGHRSRVWGIKKKTVKSLERRKVTQKVIGKPLNRKKC